MSPTTGAWESARADETVMIDIVLRRIVREGVMRLSRGTKRENFKKTNPGDVIAGRG